KAPSGTRVTKSGTRSSPVGRVLVGRAPEIACKRAHGKPDTVAQPACKDPPVLTAGVEYEHGRTIGLIVPSAARTTLCTPPYNRCLIAFAHPLSAVRCRADRDKHYRPSLEKRAWYGHAAPS